jgi:hypothetical protein
MAEGTAGPARPRGMHAPHFNLQVECPPTLISALDIIAHQANVRRSTLVRAVLAEYVELKLGPNVRHAIAQWEKHGADVLHEFMKQQVGPVAEVHVEDRTASMAYHPEMDVPKKFGPMQENDLLPENNKKRKRAPSPTDISDSLSLEFAKQKELQAPTLTESELVAADPSRSWGPLPEHFPVKQEVNPLWGTDEPEEVAEPAQDDPSETSSDPFLM